jgi:Mg2+ and Co2+ transporter CorA
MIARDTWLRDSSNRETYNRNTEFTSQYYNQFLSNVSTLWTVNDQRKLKALHNLHHRRIEYHNNIHTKEGKIDLPRRESNNADRTTTSPMFSDEIEDQVAKSEITIAYAVHFYPTTSGIESSNLFQIHTLTFGQIDKFCQSINDGLANTSKRGTKDTSYRPFSGSEYSSTNDGMAAGDDTGNETATSANGFTWIHLKDLLALTTIAEHFDIHDLIVQGFSDLRTHSAILPCIGEALMSIITCCNVGNDFKMYKLYIYLSKNLVLTFQAEILPDIAKMDITPSENIVGPIFENFMKLRKKCVQLGPAYLVYELALQALRLWDSSLEYISYALFYFHKIVHLKLLHREKLEMMIKMNIIYAGAIMFQNCINEANNVFGMLVSALLGAVDGGETISKTNSGSGRKASSKMNGLGKNSNQGNHFNRVASFSSTVNNDIEPSQLHVNGSGLRRYLVPHIFQDDVHTPYFLDLADAFLFTDSCLQSIVEDLGRVSNELDATIQLRTANTSITLSLVATIFLPLTFFAGVFGMNFTVDGGYTIPLLNMKHGPAVFDILCIGKDCICLIIFYLVLTNRIVRCAT